MDQQTEDLKRNIVAALKEERWADALPFLEAWCDRFPNHAKSWLNRGFCLYRLNRVRESVAAFDRCLELDSTSVSARSWRERALAALDDAHTVAQESEETPAVTAAMPPESPDVTRRASGQSEAPRSFATMAIPDTRRGWQEGTVIDGRYEVRATARGGMAVVAIAFDRELLRMVAIKTPLPSMLASADGRARFQREAESWVALGVHPNICCAYYLQEIGGMPRLFIEYVDGGDLNEWLKAEDERDLAERLDIAIQIASGLDYTNTFPWTDDDGVEHRGLVHRDVKPANVLLTTDGIARVTDFGLVRSHSVVETGGDADVRDIDPTLPSTARPQDSVATGTWQTVTAAGGLVGTPPYMAPELWRQAQRGTVATDIYAYGCLLYEVFCGRRPFVMSSDSASQTREAHLGSLMRMHLRDDPPDPRTISHEIDPRLAALMQSCLAKDPDGRPHSFADLRRDLVALYEEVTGKAYPRPEPKRTQLLADSLNNRGASFVSLGLVDRAQASFREALDIDPRHLEATFNSGVFEWRREGLTDAELERRLAEAESSAAGTERAALLRSRLGLLLDDPVGALEALDAVPPGDGESLAVRRTRAFAMLAAARAAAATPDFERVRELLHGVVEESPSDLPAMVGFAECCRLVGDEAMAEEALSAARSLDRDLEKDLDDAVAAHLPGHRVDRTTTCPAPVQSLSIVEGGRVAVRTAGAEAFVWNPDEDRFERRIDLGGPARQGRSMTVAGGALVACLENAPLAVLDPATGMRISSFRPHPGVATCVGFSPDGETVASGGSDRALRLWKFRTGECERTLQGHEAFVSALAWHPTEPWIVTASADGTARLWNLFQGRCVHVFEGHSGPLRSVAVAADGRLAATAGQDGAVGVWDMVTGENVRFLRGHHGAATAVAVVGESIVAGGEDGTIRLWGLKDGESERVIRLANPIQDLAVLVEGGSDLVAAFGSTVNVVPLRPLAASPLPLALADSAVSGELAGREQGFQEHLQQARDLIASGNMEEAVGPLRKARAVPGYELHQEALELWSRVLAFFPKAESRTVVELRRMGDGHGTLTACGVTPDGTTCLAGGSDGSLASFDTRSGERVFSVAAHADAVTAIAASSDGALAATAGLDGSVRVWRTADGERRYSFGGSDGAVRSVVFAPGDTAVFAAGDDKVVRVWRLEETARAETLGGCDEAISALAVSADGRYLVGGGWDSLVTVWSLRRRVELRRMEGHDGAIRAVAVGPDCRLVASAGEDGTVRLWDLEGGRLWRSLEGHDGAVKAVAFTPDGRHVLSAGKDASLRLWDVRTGKSIRVVKGHTDAVAGVAIDRDGGTAFSVGADASARLWFLDWEPELQVRGQWDDRARPFLRVFLRQRENEAPAGARPTWSEHQLEALLEGLGRRGFGWLSRKRVEQELERLVQFRDESRAEEQRQTRDQAKRRARQVRVAPVKDLVGGFGKNIGLKAAAVAAAVIVVLVALFSLTSPGGSVKFGRQYREIGVTVQARSLRMEQGLVMAYQMTHSAGSDDCGQELFSDLVNVALNAESLRNPAPDPGAAADEAFRNRYANAVNCVGRLGEVGLTGQVLRRAGAGLHPKRREDFLSILVGINAARDPLIVRALTDRSEAVRHLAAQTLIFGEDDHGEEALLAALNGEDRRGVEAATSVLSEMMCLGVIDEDEAFETVRRFCQNIDPQVRRNAVRALALFEDKPPVREVLESALEDSDPDVVEAARAAREIIDQAG